VGLILPAFDLTHADDAIAVYIGAGLRPILVHAPTAGGGCTCGQDHEITASKNSSAGKHPIAKNWQKGTATLDELQDQLARLRFRPNVGIVLGKQPGGAYLVAIDVDDEARLKVLEAELGVLPETVRCDSGRGYRLLYELGDGIDAGSLKNVSAVHGEPGVDIKAERGQIVVAPSVHQNGKMYQWTRVGEIALLPSAWTVPIIHYEVPEFIQAYTPQALQASKRDSKTANAWLERAIIGNCATIARANEGTRNTVLHDLSVSTLSACNGAKAPGSKWDEIGRRLVEAGMACGLSEKESQGAVCSAQKWVLATGAVRVPVPLFDPGSWSGVGGLPPGAGSASGGMPSPPPRPVIRITTELHLNVDASIVALKADQNLYQRDGKLTHVTRVSQEESDKSPGVTMDDDTVRHALVEGSPQIREMSLATLRERMTSLATYQKYNERAQDWRPSLPTDPIVAAAHSRGEWRGIKPIIGIVEAPTMRPDGSIVQEPGYDAATGYLYQPSQTFPRVPESPTVWEARVALKMLLDVFANFPYVTNPHKSVPIAAILTLVARPAITGATPAFLFDSSTRGSGKTLQTDAIATILTGRGMPRMNYPNNEDELEKVLASYALRGAPFFSLDNVTRPFGGGALDRVITARDSVDLRVLGKSEVPTLPWRTVVLATGNNLSLFADTARRVLITRIEPVEERPETRTEFLHDDLPGWVRSERANLVVAALTVLRAYYVAGRPQQKCDRWGSFEEWSRLIPHAIVWAGGFDPMLARPASDCDVDTDALSYKMILSEFNRLYGAKEFLIRDVIKDLFGTPRDKAPDGTVLPDGKEGLRESVLDLCDPKHGLPTAKLLGRRLGRFRGRVMDGKKLTNNSVSGILKWSIVQVVGQKVATEIADEISDAWEP
jgi:hypothetical protein